MRKFAVGNRSLRLARQFRVLSAAVRLVGIFVGIGEQTFMANFAIPAPKADRQAQQVAARPFKRWADE